MYENLRREIAKMNEELPARPSLIWADGTREYCPLGKHPLSWYGEIMDKVRADPEAARRYAAVVDGKNFGQMWELIAALAHGVLAYGVLGPVKRPPDSAPTPGQQR